MRDAGRLAAAIDVLTQIDERHRPVRMALKNWGEAARYAGSKDRAFVSGLVLDVLRRRRSLGWRMGDESLRAAALGALRFVWDWPLERVAEAAGEEPHGPGPLSDSERTALDPFARSGAVETIPQFSKGWFEVQDLGSQIAAASAGDVKGKQVLDLCAGGGGKTLALASAMGNSGQIYAYDSDARRLADTIRRGDRAGVRNLQVRSPVNPEPLKGLEAKMDVVFIDAPCSGSGSWRRHPDTKWRLTPETLEKRMADQDAVLDAGAPFVKPGGRLVYVTCSVLPEEDEDRVASFLTRSPGFAVRPATDDPKLIQYLTPDGFLRLTPRTSGTDGFFVAVLEKPR